MPPTSQASDQLIDQLNQVRKFFLENPDQRCVPLFLNCFGDGDAHGVYQLIENVIRPYPKMIVVPALASALKSRLGSVRYWCAQIAADHPHQSLEEPLIELLKQGTHDERYAAASALEILKTPRSRTALQEALEIENDVELREVIVDALSRF